jgi:hypothetical protein
MLNVRTKLCEFEEGCDTQPSFNIPSEKTPRYCGKHKSSDMIDVSHNRCLTNLCDIVVHNKEKFKGYCFRCFINMFPDDPLVKNFKNKEKSVSEFIINSFKENMWIKDKQIFDGCSKRRPDLLCDLGYQILIVEIDENQHQNYNSICENKRIMEISKDLSHRPIIFIRFNPDNYLNKEGTKIKSCWTFDKKGICRLNRENFKEWNERLNVLKNAINFWIENKTDKMLETVHLFYDGF